MSSGYARLNEEFRDYSQLLHKNPENPDIIKNLCRISSELGNYEIAEKLSGFLVKKHPGNATYHHSFGCTLYNNRKWNSAKSEFINALNLQPGNTTILFDLAKVNEKLADFDSALQLICQYNDQTQNDVSSRIMTARLYEKQANPEKAFNYLNMLIDEFPNNCILYNALGQFYLRSRNFIEATSWFKMAMSVNPDHAFSCWNFALSNLTFGNFQEGWKWFNKRLDIPEKRLPSILEKLNQPELKSRKDIKNKSILIVGEEGFGDIIQFSRYASLLKESGAENVFLHCRKPVLELMKCCGDIDGVFCSFKQIPTIDNWIMLLSLPHLFKTDFDSIPAQTPYIHPGNNKKIPKLNKDDSTLKIGVVWETDSEAPGDRVRSCSFDIFSKIFHFQEASFYSLQFPDQPDKINSFTNVMNCVPTIKSFIDTAGIIKNMDLVITIDSAVAHLAGAMNKPVWMLVAHRVYDWRWFDAFPDSSPWYPGMKIFRQKAQGDWTPVIDEIKTELKKYM